MIIEIMCNIFYNFLISLVGYLPAGIDLPGWYDNTLNVLSYGLMFFPADVLLTVVGSGVFWMSANFLWAIIEWIYRKIPGIN